MIYNIYTNLINNLSFVLIKDAGDDLLQKRWWGYLVVASEDVSLDRSVFFLI